MSNVILRATCYLCHGLSVSGLERGVGFAAAWVNILLVIRVSAMHAVTLHATCLQCHTPTLHEHFLTSCYCYCYCYYHHHHRHYYHHHLQFLFLGCFFHAKIGRNKVSRDPCLNKRFSYFVFFMHRTRS